jgi:hypothetical protein
MFTRLKNKWKVSWLQFILIFCTFAIGGSFDGKVVAKIIQLIGLEKNFTYYLLYLLLLTILWPIAVLLISIPLGQFTFFKKYIGKIGKRVLRK